MSKNLADHQSMVTSLEESVKAAEENLKDQKERLKLAKKELHDFKNKEEKHVTLTDEPKETHIKI